MEYLNGWTKDNDESEIKNPSLEELELFNIAAGISRQKVPKK